MRDLYAQFLSYQIQADGLQMNQSQDETNEGRQLRGALNRALSYHALGGWLRRHLFDGVGLRGLCLADYTDLVLRPTCEPAIALYGDHEDKRSGFGDFFLGFQRVLF